MKIIMEQWRTFLKEQDEEEISIEGFMEFDTIGDLRKALAAVAKMKRLNLGVNIAGTVTDAALNLGTGGISSIFRGLWKAAQKNPGIANTNPALNKLMVDPEVSRVVDDEVEEAFIKDLAKEIEGKNDDDKLEDMDMTRMLGKFIMKDYDGTIVTPKKEQ